jgi:hypothetical protein
MVFSSLPLVSKSLRAAPLAQTIERRAGGMARGVAAQGGGDDGGQGRGGGIGRDYRRVLGVVKSLPKGYI